MPEYLLQAFVVLLVVVDPLGNAPVFAALTPHMSAAERRRTALKAVTLVASMLAAFALFGRPLLGLLGLLLAALAVQYVADGIRELFL